MTKLFNYLAFNAVWYAAVEGAARGNPWSGPLAALALVVVHLGLVPRGQRLPESLYLLAAGVFGTLADSILQALGLLRYPTSPSGLLVPPWISALWVAFATMPRFSLAWLVPRLALAAVFGAIAGPLSFEVGRRMGAIDGADELALTRLALALEYGLATPALLLAARRLHSAP